MPQTRPDRHRREPEPLDDISKAIVVALQKDGRRAYASIGQEVGLSEAAVRQRVQKLTHSGLIQIVAVTDPVKMGVARQALIGVRTTGDISRVADEICALEAADYVVVTAGGWDIIVEVVAGSDDDLLHLLETIRRIDGVAATESFLYLSLRKQTYSWGVQ